MRLGYMGHLTLIAEEVCKFGNRHSPDTLDPAITERVSREAWTEYVEGTLAETRDKDNAVLGGHRPQDMGVRGMGGLGGGFSANTASALASAGLGAGSITPADSLALAEGQAFEIHAGRDDEEEDEEEMEDEKELAGVGGRRSQFTDDEQVGELSFEDVDMDYR